MKSRISRTFTSISFFFFFLFVILPTIAGLLNPKEYLALQSIRKSLHELPGSTSFSSWDFTSDPCAGFAGVICSGDRVVSLSLGDPRAGSPGLTGRLSPAIGQLPFLAELSLVPGRVFGKIPETLSQCSHLRFLALSQNYLSGEIPPSFSRFKNLRTLDLSFNLLSGQIPHMPSLENLILTRNRLTGRIPKSFSRLVRLDLKRNNLIGTIPALPRTIRYLSLSSNRISGEISVIGTLSGLNFLDLSSNRLAGPIPAPIFSFPISDLYLQRNFFSGVVRVTGPARMEAVDLSYNRLGGRIPAGLAEAERVYLNSNRFTGEVPARFVERVAEGGIRVLYLQHNFLTGFGIGNREIPRSVSLCVQYNCMVPPAGMVCPARAGLWRSRPPADCRRWRKRKG